LWFLQLSPSRSVLAFFGAVRFVPVIGASLSRSRAVLALLIISALVVVLASLSGLAHPGGVSPLPFVSGSAPRRRG
jgi:phosphotransferase system  glucose/maltose/N-acetylglucosamine-specific IIC component